MKQYMTGFEKCCMWLTVNDDNILLIGSILTASGLFMAWGFGVI